MHKFEAAVQLNQKMYVLLIKASRPPSSPMNMSRTSGTVAEKKMLQEIMGQEESLGG